MEQHASEGAYTGGFCMGEVASGQRFRGGEFFRLAHQQRVAGEEVGDRRFSQVVQIGELAGIYEQLGNNTQRIWKMLAYVGRYGHQPVDVASRLTVRQLHLLSESVAELVREENATAQPQQ